MSATFERALIGAALVGEAGAAEALAELGAGALADPWVRAVAELIIDGTAVCDLLDRLPADLRWPADGPPGYHIASWAVDGVGDPAWLADRIREAAHRRRLRRAAERLAQAASGAADAATLCHLIEAVVAA